MPQMARHYQRRSKTDDCPQLLQFVKSENFEDFKAGSDNYLKGGNTEFDAIGLLRLRKKIQNRAAARRSRQKRILTLTNLEESVFITEASIGCLKEAQTLLESQINDVMDDIGIAKEEVRKLHSSVTGSLLDDQPTEIEFAMREIEIAKATIAEEEIRRLHSSVTGSPLAAQPTEIEFVMHEIGELKIEIEIEMAKAAIAKANEHYFLATNNDVPAQPIDLSEFLDIESEFQIVAEVLDL